MLDTHFYGPNDTIKAVFKSHVQEFNDKLRALCKEVEEVVKTETGLSPGDRIMNKKVYYDTKAGVHKDRWEEEEYRGISIEGNSWFQNPTVIQTNPLLRHNDIDVNCLVNLHPIGKNKKPHKRPAGFPIGGFLSFFKKGDIKPVTFNTADSNVGLDILKDKTS